MSGIETGNRRHSRRDAMRQGVRGFARRARRNVQNLEAIGVVGATLLTGKGDIAARSNRQPSSPITASYQEQSGSHTQEETNNQRQTKERSPRKSHPKPRSNHASGPAPRFPAACLSKVPFQSGYSATRSQSPWFGV